MKRTVLFIWIIFIFFSCTHKDNNIVLKEEQDTIDYFSKEFNFKDISEYEEIYRLYALQAKRLPKLISIIHEDNNWYIVNSWMEIIGEIKLFSENDVILIPHEDKYLIDDIDINSFIKKTKNIDRLNNIKNNIYFDSDYYYVEFKNKKTTGIIVFEDDGFNNIMDHIKILDSFNILFEKYIQ